MKHRVFVPVLVALAVVCSAPAGAQEKDAEPGQVKLPLDTYNQLVDASREPVKVPRPVPAAYAIGSAQVTATVSSGQDSASATVTAEVRIQVFENEWSSVPVLPSGTAVQSATVNGRAVQLVASPYGLVWGIDRAGSYAMSLVYRVDATRSEAGFALPLPVPEAAATTLNATLPGSGLDVAVIPGSGVQVRPSGGSTQVSATVPTTSGVQISWRLPARTGHALSRAAYSGTLQGDSVVWQGELRLEVFADESITLPLLPRAATLRDVRVDGKEAPILLDGGSFATLVTGRGVHRVTLGFQVPVQAGDGPPHVDMVIPEVPVSRFDLRLPGKKDVTVSPAGSVSSRMADGDTVATVFVAMGSAVSFTWAEAVPAAVKAEVRLNAAVYHTVHAEEGVLFVRAMVVYQVTRGETNVLKLELPPGVQVNRISSPSGAVADWRVAEGRGDSRRQASVFLDRKVSGEIMLDVSYDRSLGDGPLPVPLLRAADAQRQRGMVALLSSKELTLKPVDEAGATRVGENQLPAFVRDAVEMTVAHTFKYVDLPTGLTVEAQPPERKQGRFDAQVDTLISLAGVVMRGQASVEVNVKSGGIMELELGLPTGVNLLSLTGPSLRTHEVEPSAGGQRVQVHFTQEMEGQFRLEVGYEHILVDAEPEVEVPTVSVVGAEVEQGRLAVEAKSAVEVQAAAAERLTPLDIAELPQQLVLRTTNPILLAYKYVKAEPPHRLVLKITRHEVVEVQEAAIDQARYSTLFTEDGLAVTTAEFVVRNSRKQFLRLELPPGSSVWSAFVDGKAEKPALEEAGEGADGNTVLIKIITSTSGFPVQLIYASEGAAISGLGTVKATLPRPDILVTQSSWDVYLPTTMSYGDPETNMSLESGGQVQSMKEVGDEMARLQAGAQVVEPLRITVPAEGVHFRLTKIYPNQSGQDVWLRVPYASKGGAAAGAAVVIVGTLLLWLGIALLVFPDQRVPRPAALGLGICGLLVLLVTHALLRVSLAWFLWLSLAFALALALRFAWLRLTGLRGEPAAAQESAVGTDSSG